MLEDKKIVELKVEELTNVVGGTEDFQEAEDLDLTSKEQKELRRKKKKEDISNKLKDIFLYSDSEIQA